MLTSPYNNFAQKTYSEQNIFICNQLYTSITKQGEEVALEGLPPIMGLPEGARLENTIGYQMGAAIRNVVINASHGIKSVYDSIYNNASNLLFTAKELFPYSETRNNIKNALNHNNITELSEACHANPAAEIICPRKLKEILSNNEVLTPEQLNELEALLASGVQCDQSLLYKKAILTQDSLLVDMLARLKMNTSIRMNIQETTDSDNPQEFYKQLLANPNYKQFAEKLSLVFSDPLLVERMKENLQHNYKKILSEIQLAKKENSGKPLLILMGEQHYNINCLFSEILTMYLAKHELNTNVLHSEIFPADSEQQRSDACLNLKTTKLLEDTTQRLDWKYQPIDVALCKVNWSNYILSIDSEQNHELCNEHDSSEFLNNISPFSEEGMKLRNDLMIKELINRNIDKDAIALVGATHLLGMSDDEKLQKHLHVLPIVMSTDVVGIEIKNIAKLTLENYFNSDYTYFDGGQYLLPNDELYLTVEQYEEMIKNIVESENNAATEFKEFESLGKPKDKIIDLNNPTTVFIISSTFGLLLLVTGLKVFAIAVRNIIADVKKDIGLANNGNIDDAMIKAPKPILISQATQKPKKAAELSSNDIANEIPIYNNKKSL